MLEEVRLLQQLHLQAEAMALTASQVREHVGAMLQYGFINLINSNLSTFENMRMVDLLQWARAYRRDGSLSTLANRTEAMQTFVRFLFQNTYGKDPTGAGAHFYKTHWLPQYIPDEVDVL